MDMLQRLAGVYKKPILGPILIGLFFGGAPYAFVTGFYWEMLGNPGQILLLLFPLFLAVSVIGGISGKDQNWRALLFRVLLTSGSASLFLPTAVCAFLLWEPESPQSMADSLPVFIYVFAIWSLVVTAISWALALIYVRFRHSRHRGA